VLAGFLVAAGRLADLLGRNRIFVLGVVAGPAAEASGQAAQAGPGVQHQRRDGGAVGRHGDARRVTAVADEVGSWSTGGAADAEDVEPHDVHMAGRWQRRPVASGVPGPARRGSDPPDGGQQGEPGITRGGHEPPADGRPAP
jgi:hypothetical protein